MDVIGTGEAAITKRQFEAFRLVFTAGLSYEQAAQVMGITRQAVQKHIKKIKHKYPDCVPKTNKPKMFSLQDRDNGQIKEKW